jgi:hypothetical protein
VPDVIAKVRSRKTEPPDTVVSSELGAGCVRNEFTPASAVRRPTSRKAREVGHPPFSSVPAIGKPCFAYLPERSGPAPSRSKGIVRSSDFHSQTIRRIQRDVRVGNAQLDVLPLERLTKPANRKAAPAKEAAQYSFSERLQSDAVNILMLMALLLFDIEGACERGSRNDLKDFCPTTDNHHVFRCSSSRTCRECGCTSAIGVHRVGT